MNKSFVISQWLYVTASEVPFELQSLSSAKCADGSVKFALASDENKTIYDQYQLFKGTLDRIVNAFSAGKCEAVFSVAVKAYEYIPEISFPPELLRSISRINSSIDVDVINMAES